MIYYPEIIKQKIIANWNEMDHVLARWRFLEKKVVFTNGCFDIIHLGHTDYLSKAASLGDEMIVGLNSDASIRSIKGSSRPVQDEKARAYIMASFSFVSKVVIFGEDTPLELIQYIQPDILVKGSDYAIDEIVGADVVKAKGGEIKTIDLVKGYSTTSIIEKLK
jgi:rfaE bifunctional protein nucleotidyltransferase chain/domain